MHMGERGASARRFWSKSLKEAIDRFHQADVPGRDPGAGTPLKHDRWVSLTSAAFPEWYFSGYTVGKRLSPGSLLEVVCQSFERSSMEGSEGRTNVRPEKWNTNRMLTMTKILHGKVHGRNIELDEDPGVAEGQEVEVQVKVIPRAVQKTGEGFVRTEGALADDEEWDAIIEESHRERKRGKR
jgi:hypothetical protein